MNTNDKYFSIGLGFVAACSHILVHPNLSGVLVGAVVGGGITAFLLTYFTLKNSLPRYH